MNRIIAAAVLGQLVGLLGYIDPIYVPLVLGAPLVTGAVTAARRLPWLLVAVLWASAGINMTWVDWVLYREDVVYHLALSVVMPLLAAVGYGVVTLIAHGQRRRGRQEERVSSR